MNNYLTRAEKIRRYRIGMDNAVKANRAYIRYADRNCTAGDFVQESQLIANIPTRATIVKYCEELGEEVPANLSVMSVKDATELQIVLWQRTAKYKEIRASRLALELKEKLDAEIAGIRERMVKQ